MGVPLIRYVVEDAMDMSDAPSDSLLPSNVNKLQQTDRCCTIVTYYRPISIISVSLLIESAIPQRRNQKVRISNMRLIQEIKFWWYDVQHKKTKNISQICFFACERVPCINMVSIISAVIFLQDFIKYDTSHNNIITIASHDHFYFYVGRRNDLGY